jgi:hypothetical protein
MDEQDAKEQEPQEQPVEQPPTETDLKTHAADVLGYEVEEILAVEQRLEGLSVVTTFGEKFLLGPDGDIKILAGAGPHNAADFEAPSLPEVEEEPGELQPIEPQDGEPEPQEPQDGQSLPPLAEDATEAANAPGGPPEPLDRAIPQGDEPYAGWTVEDLEDELRARDLPLAGNKAEQLERLRADDAADAAAEPEKG